MSETDAGRQKTKETISKVLLVCIGLMGAAYVILSFAYPESKKSDYAACLEASSHGFGKRDWCALKLTPAYRTDKTF